MSPKRSHSICLTKYVQIDAEVEEEDNFVYYYNTKEWNPKSGSFPEEEEDALESTPLGEFETFGVTWLD